MDGQMGVTSHEQIEISCQFETRAAQSHGPEQQGSCQHTAPDFLDLHSFGVDSGNFDDPHDPQFEDLDTGLFGNYSEPNFGILSEHGTDRSGQVSAIFNPDVDAAGRGAWSQPEFPAEQFDLTMGTCSSPTVSSEVHHAMFSRNLLSNCDATGITLPWETEFYKRIFGDDSTLEDLVPKVPVSGAVNLSTGVDLQRIAEDLADVADVTDPQPVFASHVSCVDDENFLERRENLRGAAIWKLLVVIRHCLSASSTGRHILELGVEAAQSQEAVDVVSAVVGVKSPATLIKRANALLSFLRWVDKSCQIDGTPSMNQQFGDTCVTSRTPMLQPPVARQCCQHYALPGLCWGLTVWSLSSAQEGWLVFVTS